MAGGGGYQNFNALNVHAPQQAHQLPWQAYGDQQHTRRDAGQPDSAPELYGSRVF